MFRHAKKRTSEEALPDLEIISRFKNSGETAFIGVLFKRYRHLVLGICLKYLQNEEASKDAVMEIFEQLLTTLQTHEVANFRSWLHSMARNHCLMKRRKQQRQPVITKDPGLLAEILFVQNSQIEHLCDAEEKAERLRCLNAALSRLDEAQKTCVELFYLNGKSYKEITQMTGYTLNQVRSHIQSGKRNLKKMLAHR